MTHGDGYMVLLNRSEKDSAQPKAVERTKTALSCSFGSHRPQRYVIKATVHAA